MIGLQQFRRIDHNECDEWPLIQGGYGSREGQNTAFLTARRGDHWLTPAIIGLRAIGLFILPPIGIMLPPLCYIVCLTLLSQPHAQY